MYKHIYTPQQNSLQSAAESDQIKKSTFQLKDNRNKIPMQRKEEKPLDINSSAPIQMQRYSVVRDIPLVPHVKRNKDISGADEKKKVRNKMLGLLRNAYPVHGQQGTPEELDAHRGPVFAAKKLKLETDVRDNAAIDLRGAHVAHIDTRERDRAGTTQAALINRITGKANHWIGAHLVKREWGGEDNMWNVVAWPKKAEDAWAAGFENPIDTYFANDGNQKIDIGIHVEKEDEAISEGAAQHLFTTGANITAAEVDEAHATGKGKALAEKLVELRYTANRAIESVPLMAQGRSSLGHAGLGPGDTDWRDALIESEKFLVKNARSERAKLGDFGKDDLHIGKKGALNGSDAKEREMIGSRSAERAKAWKQETDNYRPGYDHFNNVL